MVARLNRRKAREGAIRADARVIDSVQTADAADGRQAMAVPAMWVLNGRKGEWIR
jgi:hypothetical protein